MMKAEIPLGVAGDPAIAKHVYAKKTQENGETTMAIWYAMTIQIGELAGRRNQSQWLAARH